METLAGRVDEIQERLWKLPTDSGGYATLELWGPVAVARGSSTNPLAAAESVYTSGQVVSVSVRQMDAWHKAVCRHIRAQTIDRESARRDADHLSGKLIELLTETLGKLKTVATVEYRPSQWYAALWEDWLLITDTHAAVLHLGWDS